VLEHIRVTELHPTWLTPGNVIDVAPFLFFGTADERTNSEPIYTTVEAVQSLSGGRTLVYADGCPPFTFHPAVTVLVVAESLTIEQTKALEAAA
jgi:hypothetical protein